MQVRVLPTSLSLGTNYGIQQKLHSRKLRISWILKIRNETNERKMKQDIITNQGIFMKLLQLKSLLDLPDDYDVTIGQSERGFFLQVKDPNKYSEARNGVVERTFFIK